MYKKIAKLVLVYYLLGLIFYSSMISFWREDGVLTLHLESIKEAVVHPDFWINSLIWPVIVACYFPDNLICHA